MIQVINKDGDPIKGLFRGENGSLIVHDPISFNKNNIEILREKEFDDLKQKVTKMESMIEAIFKKISEQ